MNPEDDAAFSTRKVDVDVAGELSVSSVFDQRYEILWLLVTGATGTAQRQRGLVAGRIRNWLALRFLAKFRQLVSLA